VIESDVRIRLARPPEATAIAVLSRDLIEYGLQWAWTPGRVLAGIRSTRSNVVVASIAPRIAGFGIMRYGDDEAHLDLLAVVTDCRRQGLGRRLVDWLERPALLGGIRRVSLEVRASNRGARTFYRQLGYYEVGRVAGYYQGREAAVRMVREIGARSSAQ
jgi:ribosomal-protein-alanine N-acetyltransferase